MFHHHPIGVPDVDRSDITHRENYLLLIDSGEFLQSARKNKISLVLHGHKHIPHRIGVTLPGQDTEVIGIVGAGSSTHGSKRRCATANMIEISSEGEVDVILHDLPGDGSVGSKPRLQLRTWSQVRRRLAEEAVENSRISSEYSNHDVSVLPWGDAIISRHMRGLGPRPHHPWETFPRIEIPINYECFTQIGPVQVACQIEKHEYEWEQIACRTHREPGYGSGEWRGFVEIRLPGDARKKTLTVTMRLVAFSAFPMNPWQARFIPRDVEDDNDDCYAWRSRIPVRKQLFVALETTGDKTVAATFEGPSAMYSRIDGADDIREYEQIVVDRIASGHRIAFTVPAPLWGSEYGISWKWGRRSVLKHQNAPAPSRLRDDLETEARNIRAGRSSSLQSKIQGILRERSRKFEAAVYVLVRRHDLEPGRLIRIAMANDAQIPSGQLREMNFGAGVAGRAASLQETIVWAPCDPDARFDETLADFYIATAESYGHTGIVAVPIPRRQPIAILSIASRRENDSLSSAIGEILKQDPSQQDQVRKQLAWIPHLADEIEKVFNRTQFDAAPSEQGTPKEKELASPSEPGDARQYCPIVPPVESSVEKWWDEAIQPVDPDRIQHRLNRYVVNLDEHDVDK